MTDRFHGYWAETPYVESHHAEQEPWRMALEARRVGGAHPDPAAPFVYCDIGCGRGYTLLCLAAALPQGRFHGVDPNPAHIAEARRIAAEAGLANIRFHEGAAEALPPGAVPPCDFIAAYGVFSWVAPAVAEGILGFIRGALKPEGLLLASINLRAGWAPMLPVRDRLRAAHAAAPGAGRARLRAAVDATLAEMGPGTAFAAANPAATAVMAGWRDQPLAYIPHELMNETWRLFTPSEAAEMFAAAGLAPVSAPLDADPGAKFRSLVLRPAAATRPAGGMIVGPEERLGAPAPQNARDLFPQALIDTLNAEERALVARSVNGTGVTLAEVARICGGEVKLKLFATINQLARAGDFASFRAPPAPATDPARIAPVHPLTPALLAPRHAIAVAAHAPGPVFGGAVRLPGAVAALLRAHLEGAADLAGAAEALYRDAVSDPDFWALNDPARPREIPDFADLAARYRSIWLPFLERQRVIAPQ